MPTRNTELCPYCQKVVAVTAKNCPGCGGDLRSHRNAPAVKVFLIIVAVVVVLVFILTRLGVLK